VRQQLYSRQIDDIPAAVRAALPHAVSRDKIRKGARIALTAGSRGVDNIACVLKTTADVIREWGGEPFIVPAMGSHGGATDEGQEELLDHVFGISEKTMGCPVLSSMKVVELGRTPEHDIPVYVDEHVAKADGIIAINRIKAHTDFHGRHESGLFKIISIGMGKRAQAESIHAFGVWGLEELIPEVARAKIRMAPILGGLALLEDGYDRTTEIVGLPADRIEEEEPKLLDRAKRYQAKLPFEKLDLLVVDRMSKEISGTGMDTTVIGRRRINGAPEWESPQIEVLVIRDLEEHASNNGVGIGLADIATKRLHDKIDIKKTQVNGLTSTFAQRLMIPVIAEHDREAMDLSLYLLRRKQPDQVQMVRIRDTAHLDRLLVSEALRAEIEKNDRIEILGDAEELRFDRNNNLVPDLVMQNK
jgi:hypothetical protein